MEIIKNFGVEPVYLAAQIVNFLIIAYILKRFAYKPILTLLQKREETIKEGYKQAEEARLLLEKASEKESEILRNAQSEARKMHDLAKKESEILLAKAEDESRRRNEQMMKEAQDMIVRETKEAERKLESKIGKIAVMFLEKSLKGMVTETEKEAVMKKAIKQIKTLE